MEITEATSDDARVIAEIHLSARRAAMPYLRRPHTDEETRDYFHRVVGDRLRTWWVARCDGQVVGYLMIDGEDLDHLYVDPRHQGRGAGGTLLAKAKELSRERIVLRTFQQNAMARSFYEKRGFIVGETTDGRNEENEPDVQYVWTSQPYTEHRTEAESPVQ